MTLSLSGRRGAGAMVMGDKRLGTISQSPNCPSHVVSSIGQCDLALLLEAIRKVWMVPGWGYIQDHPHLGKGPVLVRVTVAVMKHPSQEQLGEGRVYQGKNLQAGTDAEAVEKCCLLACSICFLPAPRTTILRVALPAVVWPLPP